MKTNHHFRINDGQTSDKQPALTTLLILLTKGIRDHHSFLTACVVLALMGFLAVPRIFAQCMRTPFQPPVGALTVSVTLDEASSKTHNGFTLTRTTSDNGATIRFTVARPDQNDFAVPVILKPLGATFFSVLATFIGDHGLLILVRSEDSVNALLDAQFFDLLQPSPTVQRLFAHTSFPRTDNPTHFFLQNLDGSCLFAFIEINDSAATDTFDINVWRTDTGASICSFPNVGRNATDSFFAEIFDLPPTTGVSDRVFIFRIIQNATDQSQDCAIPLPPNLVVEPQPLDFGSIANNTTRDLNITFRNSGQDPVQVTALGSSAHFAPISFTSFTLAGGQSIQRMIRFTPGGANGPFDETLAITRCPGVGAAVVRCTGSGTPQWLTSWSHRSLWRLVPFLTTLPATA